MRITLDLPDKWLPVIDQEAAKDGHSSRTAVVRKCIVAFFASTSPFVTLSESADAAAETEAADEPVQ